MPVLFAPEALLAATPEAAFSVEALEAMESLGDLAEMAEHGHTAYELASWLNGFGGTYPIMAAVVRGQIQTVGGQTVSENGTNGGIVGGRTLLEVSVASTEFPSVLLQVQRRTYSTGPSLLPWADNPIGSNDSPATANSFSKNPSYQVNSFSYLNSSYVSGDPAALKAVWADTKEKMPELYKEVKAFHNLSARFLDVQAEVGAPSCSGTGRADALKATSPGTICWRFQDGKP